MEQRSLLNFLNACEERHINRTTDRRFITRQGLSKSLSPIDLDKFDSFLIHRSKYYFIVGKQYHLAGRSSLKQEELRGEQAITLFSWIHQEDQAAEFCTWHGIKTDTCLSYLDKNLIRELLETGCSVTFSDDTSLDKENFCSIEVKNIEQYTDVSSS
jgi:hypothetical protein